jgi:hypothetical protein
MKKRKIKVKIEAVLVLDENDSAFDWSLQQIEDDIDSAMSQEFKWKSLEIESSSKVKEKAEKAYPKGTYRDGGTKMYMFRDLEIAIDHRINTSTPGRFYLGYPERDNSNLIEDKELLSALIKCFRNKTL